MKKLALSALNELFAAINAAETLYIPADDAAGQASFTRWQAGMQLSKKLNTVRSAKDLFFPQVENLMGFRVSEKQIELIEMRDETAPFVLFGVRACDARSFEILDKVFLAEPVDTYYQARREHGTIVTMACSRPEETCFCGAFGIDAADPAGDVTCWIAGDTLCWRANTEKGEALTAKLPMLQEGGEEAAAAQQEATREILKKLPLAKLDLSKVGAGKTKEHILGIAQTMLENGQETVLITRLSEEAAEYVGRALALDYNKLAMTGVIGKKPEPTGKGRIVVATGGTSDIPVAEEAAVTAETLGNEVVRLYDVGVSGIHRLMAHLDIIMGARAIVAVAGMEGALPSVIGGLADCPVIAVPTSVGYGASLGGIAALLSMLNSCASGVSVVNIDNGFGAGYMASMINHLD